MKMAPDKAVLLQEVGIEEFVVPYEYSAVSVGLELKSDTDGIIRCSTKTSRPVCFTWVKVSGGGGNGGGGTFLCVGSWLCIYVDSATSPYPY